MFHYLEDKSCALLIQVRLAMDQFIPIESSFPRGNRSYFYWAPGELERLHCTAASPKYGHFPSIQRGQGLAGKGLFSQRERLCPCSSSRPLSQWGTLLPKAHPGLTSTWRRRENPLLWGCEPHLLRGPTHLENKGNLVRMRNGSGRQRHPPPAQDAALYVGREDTQRRISQLCAGSVHALYNSLEASGHQPHKQITGERQESEQEWERWTARRRRKLQKSLLVGKKPPGWDVKPRISLWDGEICITRTHFSCRSLIRMRQRWNEDSAETSVSGTGSRERRAIYQHPPWGHRLLLVSLWYFSEF